MVVEWKPDETRRILRLQYVTGKGKRQYFG